MVLVLTPTRSAAAVWLAPVANAQASCRNLFSWTFSDIFRHLPLRNEVKIGFVPGEWTARIQRQRNETGPTGAHRARLINSIQLYKTCQARSATDARLDSRAAVI